MEFFVRTEIRLPPDMEEGQRKALIIAELDRGRELLMSKKMKRVWRPPGTWKAVALYDVDSPQELHTLIRSLPLWPWMTVEVESVFAHPLEVVSSEQASSAELAENWP